MAFRSFDSLRLFDIVARHLSFTAAAAEVNLTKGAVSYQIKQLEDALGFAVFERKHRGIALTDKGHALWLSSQVAFQGLERDIARLRGDRRERITIGLSTYFASRWLSPRLMTFTASHPDVGLRLQPQVNLSDLDSEGLDLAIRWGKGDWRDVEIERLFLCPATPTAGAALARRIQFVGLAEVLPDLPLLHDRDGSTAWQDWHRAAGLPYHATQASLVVPDPNVRVQAVIDGQGLALNDALVSGELAAGTLVRISEVGMPDYGYFLAYRRHALQRPGLRAFRDWIVDQATQV